MKHACNELLTACVSMGINRIIQVLRNHSIRSYPLTIGGRGGPVMAEKPLGDTKRVLRPTHSCPPDAPRKRNRA